MDAWLKRNLASQGYCLSDDEVGTGMLAIVVALFVAGADTVALIFGGFLLAACASVTVLTLCLSSETFALVERIRNRPEVTEVTT